MPLPGHLGCHVVAAEDVVQEAVTVLIADATHADDPLRAALVLDTERRSPHRSRRPFNDDVLVLHFCVSHLPVFMTKTIFRVKLAGSEIFDETIASNMCIVDRTVWGENTQGVIYFIIAIRLLPCDCRKTISSPCS